MIDAFAQPGAPTATYPGNFPFSAARHGKGSCLAALQVLALRGDLADFPDEVLVDALLFALAQGGYVSAQALCKLLEPRELSLRARRSLQRARAQLGIVFDMRTHRPSALGFIDSEVSKAWRLGRQLAGPERWLHVHNARMRACPNDLRAFNGYLRSFSPLRATHTGVAAPWLRGVGFSALPRAEHGPLVSVFIAARNAQATIEYAVDSILQQTYESLELLVCDDASSDDTQAVLMRRYAREPRVRLFRSLAQQGPYNIKNALLEQAAGEFVTTHDADDLALPTRIAAQVEAARRPGMAGSITRWLRLRSDGSVVFFADAKARRLCIASLLVRRRLLQEIGGYPPARVAADLDVYGRLKVRLGAQAFASVDAPQLLGLGEAGSLTRAAGLEALETGYRSPLRRAYSERLFRRDVLGLPVEEHDPMLVFLARTGNIVAPQGIEPLG